MSENHTEPNYLEYNNSLESLFENLYEFNFGKAVSFLKEFLEKCENEEVKCKARLNFVLQATDFCCNFGEMGQEYYKTVNKIFEECMEVISEDISLKMKSQKTVLDIMDAAASSPDQLKTGLEMIYDRFW